MAPAPVPTMMVPPAVAPPALRNIIQVVPVLPEGTPTPSRPR
jgi:hypothetical protein